MPYAILRTAKLTSFANISGSARHNFREREVLNADPKRTPMNRIHGAQSAREVLATVKERLATQTKVRKNAVLAVEYFIGASPEWFERASEQQRDAYFDAAERWLKVRHGPENVIAATRQYDEGTPHMCAYVVPIDPKGKLNCSHFLDGRKKLSDMQTEFAQEVGLPFGLERGIEGSKAKHQRVKRFYTAIQREPGHVTIRPKDIEPRILRKGWFTRVEESPETIAERITRDVRKGYEPVVQIAAGTRLYREKAKQAQDAAEDLKRRLQPVMDALAPLSRDMQAKALLIIRETGKRLQEEQRKQQHRQKIEQALPKRKKPRDRGHDIGM